MLPEIWPVFRNTAVHPINKDMIHDSDIVPSLIFYQHDDHDTSQSTINIVVRTTSIFKKKPVKRFASL